MGVNARVTLRILDREHQDCSIDTFSKLRTKYAEARYAIDDHGNSTGNEGSWRGFEEDLKLFTLQEPGLHLQLDITSDYGGEPYINRFYFFGGGMQECKPELVYPPFDVRLLVPAPRAATSRVEPVKAVGNWVSPPEGGEVQLVWTLSRGDRTITRTDSELRAYFARRGAAITSGIRQHHVDTFFESVAEGD